MKDSTPGWQTSSFTGDKTVSCVEVRHDHGAIRDTKQRSGGALSLPVAGLVAFARRVGPVAALAVALVATVSSVEYSPTDGQNWHPAASTAMCRCAPTSSAA